MNRQTHNPIHRQILTRLSRALALTTAPLWLSSCGGGGISNPCDNGAFMPNYAAKLSHMFNWPGFPVRTHFVADANFTDSRKAISVLGFNQWVTATGGALSFTVTDDASAPVSITFDPTTNNGVTVLRYDGLSITSANPALGVKSIPDADLQCVAAHEFAHVLGFDGHSDDPADLMYPVHTIGQPCPVTERDLNTMKTSYCATFGKPPIGRAASTLGRGEITIH